MVSKLNSTVRLLAKEIINYINYETDHNDRLMFLKTILKIALLFLLL